MYTINNYADDHNGLQRADPYLSPDRRRHAALLVNGALSPGDQVPTVRQLAMDLGGLRAFSLGTGDGTPDACWKYGLIYYNP